MTKPLYWNEAKEYLSKKDKKLKEIIKNHDGHLKSKKNAFYSLCKSIIGQQISVQSAESVWKRLTKRSIRITPTNIHSLTKEEIQNCGVTRQKTEYLKLLAQNFLRKNFNVSKIKKLDDEEAILYLCQNKGIGRWTAEMFLIFNQNRENIFPVQDIGLLKGISRNFGTKYPPSETELGSFRKRWNPYCTVATWYIWRSVDPVPVEY